MAGPAIHCECGQCSTHEYLRPKRNFLSSNDEGRLLEASARRLLCLVDCLMSAAHRKWLINVHKRPGNIKRGPGWRRRGLWRAAQWTPGARKVSAGHFLSWRRCSSCTKEDFPAEGLARLSLLPKPFREADERRVIRGEIRCCWEKLRGARCSRKPEEKRLRARRHGKQKEENQQEQKSIK